MMSRKMSRRNQYDGSPWMQCMPLFGMGGDGVYGLVDQYPMINCGYYPNQGGYGDMYSRSGMDQMRSIGYGGYSQAHNYRGGRVGAYEGSRGNMKRKRLPQRSSAEGPQHKRPNLGSDSYRNKSKPRQKQVGSKGRHDHSDDDGDEPYHSAEPTEIRSRKCLDGQNGKRTLLPLRLVKETGLKAGMKTFQQVDQYSSQKGPRNRENWCTICKCSFRGNFLVHRRIKEHRKNRDIKYPKCHPCRLSFNNSEEYKDHCRKEDHKLKSAEFHYMKNLPGSDDKIAVEPVKPKEVEKKDDAKLESEEPAKPEEPMAVGQNSVVCVHGYYCKLCRKFFKDVSVAKAQHCRSIMHYDAFKKGMEEAKEQEEKRQKLADEKEKLERKAEQEMLERKAEQEKLERKAEQEKLEREAECLTTEITTSQTAVECKDVEMKEYAEQNENLACEKIGTSDADMTNEEMKVTSPEEVKKDAAEAKGNSASEKIETSVDADVPNGEKEEMKVATEAEVKKDVTEVKGNSAFEKMETSVDADISNGEKETMKNIGEQEVKKDATEAKEGLPGVGSQMDDIRWSLPKIKEHCKQPRVVLQRLLDAGATLNLKKTESSSSSLPVTIMEEDEIVETVRSDRQGVKDKHTNSPARRGNRGYGRRQSRGRGKRR